MNKLEIETKQESKVTRASQFSYLEIEDQRPNTISGEQTNLVLQKQADSTITLYMTEPVSIIIQKQNDLTETRRVRV